MHISRRRFASGSLAAIAAACASGGGGTEDIVLHGGPIYTGLARRPRVEALRISDGRVAFVGALSDARNGGRPRMIDLGGATAFPGFIDSHCHLGGVGLAAMALDLVGTPSIAAMQESLAAYARAHPVGPIVGRGWIETHWPEGRFPTRADLDAVVSNRPVFLQRIDGHAAVVNSAGLQLGGVTASTRDPNGGRIERDASGAPTGMLIDNAVDLVSARLPAPTSAMRREAIAAATRLYAARGWVGAANMSTSADEAAHFLDFAARGELPIRADLYMTPEDAGEVYSRGAYGQGRANVRGVKLYMDGALGSRGAALLAPYSDAPGDGLLVMPMEDIRSHLRRARSAGVQVATHAIGDRGNRLTLDAYAEAWADDPAGLRAARWRIEHAQVLSPQDLPRFASMGVIASMQPSHAISDLYFAPSRLGPDRLAGAYAWKSLLDTGALVAAGSDAPVERGDPLIEFYAATYRHALDGFAGPDWNLQEAVGREQALIMLSRAGAFACFAAAERGALGVGQRADVSVFSANLMEAPFEQVRSAHAVLTICDGEITHTAL